MEILLQENTKMMHRYSFSLNNATDSPISGCTCCLSRHNMYNILKGWQNGF